MLLRLTRSIDALSAHMGRLAAWAVLAACFISAGNALVRYGLDTSSNAWIEIQWYLFAGCVMLGAPEVLRVNEHVRVDIFYSRLPARGQALLDLLGLCIFLVPVMAYFDALSWQFFVAKLTTGLQPADGPDTLGWAAYVGRLLGGGEMSENAGGLIRWPAALLLPLGFSLVVLQGLAEVVKRVLWLQGRLELDTHYERPLQ